MDLRKQAEQYHLWGASLVPIVSKRPLIEWKTLTVRIQTLDELRSYKWEKAKGLGVVEGLGGWRSFDIDGCVDTRTVSLVLEALGLSEQYEWLVRTGSGKGYHIHFRCDETIPSGMFRRKKGVQIGKSREEQFKQLELRWENCLTVLPPSLHETGSLYEFVNGFPSQAPILVSVKKVYDAFNTVATENSPANIPDFSAPSQPPIVDRPIIEEICEKFPLLNYAREHFETERGIQRNGDEVEIRSNGGLYINPVKKVWYKWTARLGGDCIDLVGYVTHGESWERRDGMFRSVLKDTAAIAGVDLQIENQPARYSFTDDGNAQRFVDEHKQRLKYDHTRRTWMAWDEKRWAEDRTDNVRELAKGISRDLLSKTAMQRDAAKAVSIAKHAARSLSDKAVTAMLNMAKSDPEIATTFDKWDHNPLLLNCENGTFDLETMKFLEHDRTHLLTKMIPVTYNADAIATRWTAFLNDIFNGNESLIAYIARAVGYNLSGLTSAQCIFFLYGTGKNGKTVFLETLQAFFGDYSQKAPSEMLMMKMQETNTADLARLAGARFVSCSELQENRRMNEARLKDLAGGDTIVARRLYENSIQFKPTHKLWIAGNHKPVIVGTDEGTWRRIHVVPFTYTVPEERRREMPELLIDFQEEFPGILNWTLEGWRDFRKIGLSAPPEVTGASRDYRIEMDLSGQFIEECCSFTSSGRVAHNDLYLRYADWCEKSQEKPLRRRQLLERLEQHGFELEIGPNKIRIWKGLVLR